MISMNKVKMEMKTLPKRFYKCAAFAAAEGGYVITLDGKNMRTPQQKLLHCASQQLAQQIAAEWEAQIEVINTDTMPLTRLLNITLDRVSADRAALLTEIANYCETDLLFYRAPIGISPPDLPPAGGGTMEMAVPFAPDFNVVAEELAALQAQHFSPVLAWVEKKYAATFHLTGGVMPIAQTPAALAKIAAAFSAANDGELAALAMMVPPLGSALLTLAIWQGALDVEAALIAARLDEFLQEKKSGVDAESSGKWQAECRDVRAAAFFLTVNSL